MAPIERIWESCCNPAMQKMLFSVNLFGPVVTVLNLWKWCSQPELQPVQPWSRNQSNSYKNSISALFLRCFFIIVSTGGFFYTMQGFFILKNYHYQQKIPSNAHWMQHWVKVAGQDLGGSWLVSDQIWGEMEHLGSGRIQPGLISRSCV